MKTSIVLCLLIAGICASAADNTIHLQQERIIIHPPTSWQIGPQEVGREESMTFFPPSPKGSKLTAGPLIVLRVATYDLRGDAGAPDPNSTGAIRDHEERDKPLKKVGRWSIYQVTLPNPDGVAGEYRDACFRDESFLILIRLAIARVPEVTAEWIERSEAALDAFLETIELKPK